MLVKESLIDKQSNLANHRCLTVKGNRRPTFLVLPHLLCILLTHLICRASTSTLAVLLLLIGATRHTGYNIIDCLLVVNFMTASVAIAHSNMELDAARALLEGKTKTNQDFYLDQETFADGQHGFNTFLLSTDCDDKIVQRRSRSDSVGLDALAEIACAETAKEEEASENDCDDFVQEDSDEDFERLPPRILLGRQRSASNPEGMDKWETRTLFLPADILEEELAEVSVKVQEQREAQHQQLLDEANLSPEELLQRARSRLLDDLTINGDKGVLSLPHTLTKYKQVCVNCVSDLIYILICRCNVSPVLTI
jgi:hypothetical protein